MLFNSGCGCNGGFGAAFIIVLFILLIIIVGASGIGFAGGCC